MSLRSFEQKILRKFELGKSTKEIALHYKISLALVESIISKVTQKDYEEDNKKNNG